MCPWPCFGPRAAGWQLPPRKTAAVVTVATGGAAAGPIAAAVHCAAQGALVGAATQGAIGAATGAVTGAIGGVIGVAGVLSTPFRRGIASAALGVAAGVKAGFEATGTPELRIAKGIATSIAVGATTYMGTFVKTEGFGIVEEAVVTFSVALDLGPVGEALAAGGEWFAENVLFPEVLSASKIYQRNKARAYCNP